MLVGIGAAVQILPIAGAAQEEVDLIGVFRYASTYEDGIEMIAAASEGRHWKGWGVCRQIFSRSQELDYPSLQRTEQGQGRIRYGLQGN